MPGVNRAIVNAPKHLLFTFKSQSPLVATLGVGVVELAGGRGGWRDDKTLDVISGGC